MISSPIRSRISFKIIIYSRNNFSGGQGLDTAHRANGTPKDTTRFWDSKGVDVFHGDDETSYHTHLLFTTADKGINFSASNNYLAQTTNGYMYITDDTDVYQSTDEGVTWTAMTSTSISYTIHGIAAFGNDLFVVAGDGSTNKQLLSYVQSTDTWTDESLGSSFIGYFTGIWFAKGGLFVSGKSTTAEYLWESSPFTKNFLPNFNRAVR